MTGCVIVGVLLYLLQLKRMAGGVDQRTRSLLPQEDELTTALLDHGNPGAKLDRTDSDSANIGQ